MGELTENHKKIHKDTNEIRLASDLYSNVNRREFVPTIAKKIMNNNSLFKNGE